MAISQRAQILQTMSMKSWLANEGVVYDTVRWYAFGKKDPAHIALRVIEALIWVDNITQ